MQYIRDWLDTIAFKAVGLSDHDIYKKTDGDVESGLNRSSYKNIRNNKSNDNADYSSEGEGGTLVMEDDTSSFESDTISLGLCEDEDYDDNHVNSDEENSNITFNTDLSKIYIKELKKSIITNENYNGPVQLFKNKVVYANQPNKKSVCRPPSIWISEHTYLVSRYLDWSYIHSIELILSKGSNKINQRSKNIILNKKNFIRYKDSIHLGKKLKQQQQQQKRYAPSDWVIYTRRDSDFWKTCQMVLNNSDFDFNCTETFVSMRPLPFMIVLFLCGSNINFDKEERCYTTTTTSSSSVSNNNKQHLSLVSPTTQHRNITNSTSISTKPDKCDTIIDITDNVKDSNTKNIIKYNNTDKWAQVPMWFYVLWENTRKKELHNAMKNTNNNNNGGGDDDDDEELLYDSTEGKNKLNIYLECIADIDNLLKIDTQTPISTHNDNGNSVLYMSNDNTTLSKDDYRIVCGIIGDIKNKLNSLKQHSNTTTTTDSTATITTSTECKNDVIW